MLDLAINRLKIEFSTGNQLLFISKILLAGFIIASNALMLYVFKNIEEINNIKVLKYYFIVICSFSIAKDFIPSYRKAIIFNYNYIPLTILKKLKMWFIGNELNYVNVINLLTIISCILVAKIPIGLAFVILNGFIISISVSFFLRILLGYQFQNRLLFATFILGMFILFVYSIQELDQNGMNSLFFSLLSFIMFVAISFLLHSLRYIEEKSDFSFSESPMTFLFFSRQLVFSIVLALIAKSFIFGSALLMYVKKDTFIFESAYLFFLSASPFVYFSYFMNNFFAFHSSYYLNHVVRVGTPVEFIYKYMKFTSIVIIIDFLVTLSVLIITKFTDLDFFLRYYVLTVLFSTPIGLFCSCALPVKVTNASIMSGIKTYVHPLSSLSVLIASILIYNFNSAHMLIYGAIFSLMTLSVFYFKFHHLKHFFIKKMF